MSLNSRLTCDPFWPFTHWWLMIDWFLRQINGIMQLCYRLKCRKLEVIEWMKNFCSCLYSKSGVVMIGHRTASLSWCFKLHAIIAEQGLHISVRIFSVLKLLQCCCFFFLNFHVNLIFILQQKPNVSHFARKILFIVQPLYSLFSIIKLSHCKVILFIHHFQSNVSLARSSIGYNLAQ